MESIDRKVISQHVVVANSNSKFPRQFRPDDLQLHVTIPTSLVRAFQLPNNLQPFVQEAVLLRNCKYTSSNLLCCWLVTCASVQRTESLRAAKAGK